MYRYMVDFMDGWTDQQADWLNDLQRLLPAFRIQFTMFSLDPSCMIWSLTAAAASLPLLALYPHVSQSTGLIFQ